MGLLVGVALFNPSALIGRRVRGLAEERTVESLKECRPTTQFRPVTYNAETRLPFFVQDDDIRQQPISQGLLH